MSEVVNEGKREENKECIEKEASEEKKKNNH